MPLSDLSSVIVCGFELLRNHGQVDVGANTRSHAEICLLDAVAGDPARQEASSSGTARHASWQLGRVWVGVRARVCECGKT